jgi:hypothetical protein
VSRIAGSGDGEKRKKAIAVLPQRQADKGGGLGKRRPQASSKSGAQPSKMSWATLF